ncbi:MAG: hypothetical protein Q9174_004762, partial [Haloplaca sp. 1 TL-2023]
MNIFQSAQPSLFERAWLTLRYPYDIIRNPLDALLSIPALSFLLIPTFSSYSTSLNLLFFYVTWSTLILSNSPLKVEIVGTLGIRILFYILPAAGFLAFDAATPNIAAKLKEHRETALPTGEEQGGTKGRWWKIALVSTGNVLLGVVVQSVVELLFTEILHIRSALKVSTSLPMPWGIAIDLIRGLFLREILSYVAHRYALHHPDSPLTEYHMQWQHSIVAPFAFVANYDHPLAYLVHIFLPTYIPALLFRFHLLTYHMYLAIVSLEEVFGYSGYNVLPSGLILGGIARRQERHLMGEGKGNFSCLGIVDFVAGTSMGEDVVEDVREEAENNHIPCIDIQRPYPDSMGIAWGTLMYDAPTVGPRFDLNATWLAFQFQSPGPDLDAMTAPEHPRRTHDEPFASLKVRLAFHIAAMSPTRRLVKLTFSWGQKIQGGLEGTRQHSPGGAMTEQSPQAFLSSYAPRLRAYANSLLTPVIPQTTQVAPLPRTTKRGTTAINYAENEYDDDDIFEDDTGPKRPTGLRSRREDPNHGKESAADKFGKELYAPVKVQGIWRDWMNKPKLVRTEKQLSSQCALPLTLIPIRIDLDIPSFTPAPALPLPQEGVGVDPLQARYRSQEPTPAYRLKDIFMWNLHETLITPEQFALILVQDLDLPNQNVLALQVSTQIRQQLEEYAGVALHPLFHPTAASNGSNGKTMTNGHSQHQSGAGTPAAVPNGAPTTTATTSKPNVTATASFPPTNDINPDDTYRCIITLNINLQNKLFTDKFEWSLLHPPGLAERFAKQTAADIGLTGEWVPAITHAIYEAVLRLKKEACESGGLVGNGYLDNEAAGDAEAGWRYDPEGMGDEWEPKVERLSKEEIEKREGDRERQIRRLRRETARFSSTAFVGGMGGQLPLQQQQQQQQQQYGGGYFDQPVDTAETPMGRGERHKKKR